MSFSSEAKAELCQQRPDKKCCALAESYGVLLYTSPCNPASVQREIQPYCFNPFRRMVRLFDRPPWQIARPAAPRSSSA